MCHVVSRTNVFCGVVRMTPDEEREVIRVCGPDYEYLDIPPDIRKRDNGVVTVESPIPISQGRNNNVKCEEGYLDRLGR